MRGIMRGVAGVLVLAGAAASAWAGQYTFDDSGVQFTVPPGYTRLSAEEAKPLFAPNAPPSFVVGNTERTMTVSYDMLAIDFSKFSLPHARETFEKVLEKHQPGLVWKQRKVVDIEGQPWLQFELIAKNSRGTAYNVLMVTPIRDQMLVLNFRADMSVWAVAEPVLRDAVRSVKLNAPPVEVKIPVAGKTRAKK